MKKSIFAVFSVLAFALLAMTACTTPPNGAPPSPEAIAKQFCPAATIALDSLQSLDGISAANTSALTDIEKLVKPVCAAVAAGGHVAPTDLKTFAGQAIPVLTAIVKTSTMEAAKQNPILLDLAVAQIAIASLP